MTDEEKIIELLKKTEINIINGHVVLAEICFTPKVFENMAKKLLKNGIFIAPMPIEEWLKEEIKEYIYKRCIDEL